MPQVDIETLACGGGGNGRVACETVIAGDPPDPKPAVEDPDLPAESYEVRIGDEIDWTDINAVYERDDSTKGNTNPKVQHANAAADRRSSNSQRFSGNLKPKAPIIGLPSKLHHSGYLCRSASRPPNGRIFPKKGGKDSAAEREPRSPKVSCIGKVLSGRERERCRARQQEVPEQQRSGRRGFWAKFFCCTGGDRGAPVESVEEESLAPSGIIEGKKEETSALEAPGLGAMKRFASARRPSSWGGDEDGCVAWSGPLDENGFRVRRSVGTLESARREGDW